MRKLIEITEEFKIPGTDVVLEEGDKISLTEASDDWDVGNIAIVVERVMEGKARGDNGYVMVDGLRYNLQYDPRLNEIRIPNASGGTYSFSIPSAVAEEIREALKRVSKVDRQAMGL